MVFVWAMSRFKQLLFAFYIDSLCLKSLSPTTTVDLGSTGKRNLLTGSCGCWSVANNSIYFSASGKKVVDRMQLPYKLIYTYYTHTGI